MFCPAFFACEKSDGDFDFRRLCDSITQTTFFLIASVLTVPERNRICESNFLVIGVENQLFLSF